MPKPKEKEGYWRGRVWKIRPIEAGDEADTLIGADKMAAVFSNQALIVYRAELNKEVAVMAILHEVGHELFPEWEAEPSDKAASEVGIFERDLKAFLETFGVDLSPLLKP